MRTTLSTDMFRVNFATWPNYQSRKFSQVGSLAGAAHLLNDNAGVLRHARREQKVLSMIFAELSEQKIQSGLEFGLGGTSVKR